MNTIIYHPTANANVRAAAIGFAQAGILAEFHMAIATFPGDMLDRLSKFKPLAEISRRKLDPILKDATQTWPWHEAGRLLALKSGINSLTRHETGRFSMDAVYRSLDKRIARQLKHHAPNSIDAVYAYEDGAYYTFMEAHKLGIKSFYDLPIGYWRTARRMMAEEAEIWPEWAATLAGLTDSSEKLARKDEELKMADCIFVASNFTAQTLKDFNGHLSPVEIIPYGFPPVNMAPKVSANNKNKRIKLLFVGGLSQRKGIANLFKAIENLDKYVDLTLVGLKSTTNCPALDRELAKHNWIPSMSHQDILKLMHEHDVLVFPSLFEGFGLVITEAMSQGTPVITTERTVGPDIINNGENGWIVEAGSTEALQQAIEELIFKPEQIAEAGFKAMETAKARPWEAYGRELSAALVTHCNPLLKV